MKPATSWTEKRGPFSYHYDVSCFTSAVPWYVRVWFALTNLITYLVWGCVRW